MNRLSQLNIEQCNLYDIEIEEDKCQQVQDEKQHTKHDNKRIRHIRKTMSLHDEGQEHICNENLSEKPGNICNESLSEKLENKCNEKFNERLYNSPTQSINAKEKTKTWNKWRIPMKKNFLVLGMILITLISGIFTNVYAVNTLTSNENKEFITSWNVPADADNTLSSTGVANTTITLPIPSNELNNYTVDWGDETTNIYTTEAFPTHTYTNTEETIYIIKISGTVKRFGYTSTVVPTESNVYSNYYTFTQYLVSINQWGEINAEQYGFANCVNLKTVLNAATENTFKYVTSMENMFYNCTSLEILDLSNFNTSNVNNMDGMFNSCENVEAIILGNDFDKLNGKDMFTGCESLTEIVTTRTTPMALGTETGLETEELSEVQIHVPYAAQATYANDSTYSSVLGNDGIATASTYSTRAATGNFIVGSTGYATLAEAVSAVSAGGTITLGATCTDSSSVTISKNVTINTSSYTLTRTATITVSSGATLTINGSGTIQNSSSTLITNGGTVNVTSGTLKATRTSSTDAIVIHNYASGVANISGGKLYANNTAGRGYCVYCSPGTAITGSTSVSGGTLEASGTDTTYGIYYYLSSNTSKNLINITGGTFKITGNGSARVYAARINNGATNSAGATNTVNAITMSGGTINVTAAAASSAYGLCMNNDPSRIVVTGGTITAGYYGVYTGDRGSAIIGTSGGSVTATPVITGGTNGVNSQKTYFYDGILRGKTKASNYAYAATGATVVNGDDGTYKVDTLGYYYTDGTNYYSTLGSAFYDGGIASTQLTITVLANVYDDSYAYVRGQNTIVLNTNGKTITKHRIAGSSEYDDMGIDVMGSLEIIGGGTIQTAQNNSQVTILLTNNGTITIGGDVTIKHRGITGNDGWVAIYGNVATSVLTINSGTVSVVSENGTSGTTSLPTAISINAGKATINGGTINADLGNPIFVGAGTTLNINGGIVNGVIDISSDSSAVANVTMTAGTIKTTSTSWHGAVYIQGKHNFTMTGGTIDSSYYGVYLGTGADGSKVKITGGTVSASRAGVYNCSSSAVTIGNNDGSVTTTPLIKSTAASSNSYALYSETGYNGFNFYDGTLKGYQSIYYGRVITPSTHSVNITTETTNGVTYEVGTLKATVKNYLYNNVYYETLQEAAWMVPQNGSGTIIVNQNVTDISEVIIPTGTTITLNTNSKTVTKNRVNSLIGIKQYGNLTINGSGTIQTAASNVSVISVLIQMYTASTTLNLNNVTIKDYGTNKTSGITNRHTIYTGVNSSINITGATIETTFTSGVTKPSGYVSNTIVLNSTGNLTINSGTLTNNAAGNVVGLWSNTGGSKVEIKGGTLTSSTLDAISATGTTSIPINISGGTLTGGQSAVGIYNTASSTVSITGGTLKTTSTTKAAVYNESSKATVTIGANGGTPSTTVPTIQGGIYGVQSTAFNFYDGILKGTTAAYSGTPTVQQNYTIKSGTESSLKTAILVATGIASQPADVAVKNGSSPTFTVGVNGDASTYTYQWYYVNSDKNTGGTAITASPGGATASGYNTATLTLANINTSWNNWYVYCVATPTIKASPTSTAVASEAAKITVYSSPSISTNPSSVAVKVGASPTFTVAATGGNPASYTYKWYYNSTNTNVGGTQIVSSTSGATNSGVTSATLTLGSIQSSWNNYYVFAEVSNGQYTVRSTPAKITVYSSPKISSHPASVTVNEGASPTFTVAATGGNPTSYTYKWYYTKSNSNASGTQIVSSTSGATNSGVTSATLTLGSIQRSWNAYYVFAEVSNGQYTVKSNPALITVNDATAPTKPTFVIKFQSDDTTHPNNTWTNKAVYTTISSTDADGITEIQYTSTPDTENSWKKLNLAYSGGLSNSGTTYSGSESWSLYDRIGTYYFRAVDAAGNKSVASDPFYLKYDKTAPTVSLAATNNANSVTLNGTIKDEYYGVIAYAWTNSSSTPTSWTPIDETTSATQSKTVTSANIWYLHVKDLGGNTASANVTTYSVAFNANGGSGAPATQYKAKDVALTLSSTKPTRTGYSFQGWGTTSTATTVAYNAGASYTGNANTTLYAIWRSNAIDLTINPNGGIFNGSTSNTTITNDVGTTIEIPSPLRSGYKFNGWTLSGGGTLTEVDMYGYRDPSQATLSVNSNNDLVVTSSGNDPKIYLTTNISADTLKKVRITMDNAASTAAQIFFSTGGSLSEANSVKATLTSGAANQVALFDFSSNSGWTGTVTYLRIDVGSAVGEYVIKKIEYLDANNNVLLVHDNFNEKGYKYTYGDTDGTLTANWTAANYNVGDGYYATLATAYTALKNAGTTGTINVYNSNTDNSSFTVANGYTVTLNTNAKTVTKTTASIAVSSGGTLIIDGTGTIQTDLTGASTLGSLISNSGTVTVKNGTLHNAGHNAAYWYVINGASGTTNIQGGTIKASLESGVTTTYNGRGLYTATGTINVSGGEITSSTYGIHLWQSTGTINISGGRITAGSQAINISGTGVTGKLNVTGGTLIATGGPAISTASTGGTVIGTKGGSVSTTSPVLQGTTYGINATNGFDFYDGILKGKSGGYSGKVNNWESGYGIATGSETISSTTYKTAYLATTPTTPTITVKNASGTAISSGAWANSNLTITIGGSTISSGSVGYQYRINEGTWTNYSSAITYSTEIANAKFEARAYNTSATSVTSSNASFTINLDKTAPKITSTTQSPTGYTNGNVTLMFSATDNLSGVSSYATSPWSYANCTSFKSITVSTNVSNQTYATYPYNRPNAYLIIKDKAGNTAQITATGVSTIDRTAPIITNGTTHTAQEYYNNASKGTQLDATAGFTSAASSYQGGTIAVTSVNDGTVNSSQVLKITHASGKTTSGYQRAYYYETSKVYVRKIYAKIPTGYTLNITGNSVSGSRSDITSLTGTGTWKEYSYVYTVSDTATSTMNYGHAYISGTAPSSAFDWYVATDVTYDVTNVFDDVKTTYGNNTTITITAKDTQSGTSSITVNGTSQTLTTSGTSKVATYTVGSAGTYAIVATDAVGNSTSLTKTAYTITYNGNSSTGGSTAAQIKINGANIPLRTNGFTKTGYSFKNWNTKADGSGTSYVAGATYTGDANTTLYAQWQANTFTVANIANVVYTGSALTPEVTVKDGSTTLKKGTHYTVSYSNNTNVGTATVTVTGIGDYSTCTQTANFTITEAPIKGSVTISGTLTYGSKFTPTISNLNPSDATKSYAWFANDTKSTTGGTQISTGSTYTVNSKAYGKYLYLVVTVSKANYETTKLVSNVTEGTIGKRPVTVTAGSASKVYDGTALTNAEFTLSETLPHSHTATVTMTSDSTITNVGSVANTISEVTLKSSSGSTVNTYYTITTVPGTLTVTQATISSTTATIGTIADQTYTGSAITPTPTVTFGGNTLKKDTDYTLSYSNNTNVGTATVTATGKGNYKGSISATFKIVAAAPTFSVSPTTLGINKGATGTITITYNGDGALSAKSSATGVANVSLSGKAITVTGVAAGTATITVSAAAGTNYKAATDKTVSVSVYGAPTTPTITVKNASGTTIASNNWSTSALTITLSGSTLAGPGSVGYQYSYDGKTWTNYASAITYNTNTSSQVLYAKAYNTSSNNKAMVSSNATYTIRLDTGKPGNELLIDNGTEGNWTNKEITAKVTGTDSVSGVSKIQYSTDNSTWTDLDTTTASPNLIKNSDFSETTTVSLAWDESKNSTIQATSWGSGYNSGVDEPTIGYHAHVSSTDFDYNVLKFVNKNSEVGYTKRWLGITQSVTGVKPGTTYTLSYDLYGDTVSTAVSLGLRYYETTNSTVGFHNGQGKYTISADEVGKWTRVTYTFTTIEELNTAKSVTLYIYGHSGAEGITYLKNIQLEEGDTATAWTSHSSDQTSAKKEGTVKFDETYSGTIYSRTIDVAGNVSAVSSAEINVDTDMPKVEVSNITYPAAASIKLTDSHSGIRYFAVTKNTTAPTTTGTTDVTTGNTLNTWYQVANTTSAKTVSFTGLSAGTYYAWGKDLAGNYTSTQFTVGKATPTVTLEPENDDVAFNASNTFTVTSSVAGKIAVTSGATNVSITGGNGATLTANKASTVTYKGAAGTTSAIKITVVFTPTDTTNYNSVTKTYTVNTVNKIANTLKVIANTGLTYTGSAQTLVTASGAQGDVYYAVGTELTSSNHSTAGSKTIPTGTDAKDYKVYYYTPGNSNYSAASGNVTVTIANAKITGNVSISGTLTYGSTLTSSVSSLTPSDATKSYQWYTNSTKSTTGGSPISGATSSSLSLVGNQFGKYVYLVVTVSKTNYDNATLISNVTESVIGQRPITVTAGSSSKVYDGTALTNSAFTASETLPYSHRIEVTMTNDSSITNVGSVANTINTVTVYSTNNSDVTEYYKVTKVAGTLTVTQATISSTTATIGTIADQTYTGSAITPTPTVTFGGNTLKKDTDYTLSYSNNTNVGTATVTVTGKGNFKGSVSATFKIVNAKMSGITATGHDGVYDGAAHGITVSLSGTSAGATVKYGTKSGTYNLTENPTYSDVGTYTVYYQVTKANYETETGSKQVKITVATPTITIKDKTVTYNGSVVSVDAATTTGVTGGVAPTGTVTYTYYTDSGCTSKTSTTDNSGAIVAGGAPKNAGTYYAKATIAANGNYAAATSAKATITINVKPLTITWGETSFGYTGNNQKPTATVSSEVTGEKVNLSVTGEQSAVGGPYTATASISSVTGTNNKVSNYSLTNPETKFYITNDNITLNATSKVPSYTYDGTAKTPAVTVTAVVGGVTKTLTLNTDYTVTYDTSDTAKDVGTKTITITGKGDYAGKGTTATFTITPKELTLTPNAGQNKVYGTSDPTLTYTFGGNEDSSNPGVNGALSREYGNDVKSTYKITQGTLTLADNGTFKASNYTLKFTEGVTFAITQKNIAELSLSLAQTTYTYDGTAKTPGLNTITYAGKNLVAGTDYEITYDTTKNVNAGQATATITGKGNFNGSKTLTFTISEKSVSGLTITLNPTSYEYDGNTKTPTITVKDGEATLTKDTDYTVSGTTSAKDVGTYTITITGKGNYSGTKEATYTITSISNTVTVTGKTDLVYTGNSQELVEVDKAQGDVYYARDTELTADNYLTAGSTDIPKGKDADTYTVYYYTPGNNNYKEASGSVTVTIARSGMTGITASNYTGTYDGKAHGITVSLSGTSAGATVKYGTTSGTYNLTENPTYSDAGTYTVYYEVSKANYDTVTGSATITINKATAAVVWSNTRLVYNGTALAPIAADIAGVNGETIKLNVSGAQTAAGKGYTATASIASVVKSDTTAGNVDNYTLTNASTTFDIIEGNYSDDTNVYETLKEAFDNAVTGRTITVLQDVEEDASDAIVAANKEFVLDTNGYTITKTTKAITIKGTLEITGTGTITTSTVSQLLINEGTLNITGECTLSSKVNYVITNRGSGIANISNAKIIGESTYTLSNSGTGTININSGEITAKNCALANYTGTINISGGTIFGSNTIRNNSTGTIKITNGAKVISTGITIINDGGGKIIIGENDGNVNTQTPIFEANTAKLYSESNAESTLEFYDGILKSTNTKNVIGAEVPVIPDGYGIKYGEETIDGTKYYTAVLALYETPETPTIIATAATDTWSTSAVTVTVKASTTEPVGGQTLQYKLNDGEWTNYEKALIIDTEGTTIIYARAVNTSDPTNTSLTSEAESYIIKVDTAKPEVTTNNITFGETASITLKDATSGVVGYIVSESDATPTASSDWLEVSNATNTTVTYTSIKATTYYVWAIDEAGNISEVAEIEVSARNISEASVFVDPSEYDYDGTAKKPTVVMSVGKTALVESKDFTVTHDTTADVGTKTITIIGIGNYTGSRTENFEIKAVSPIITIEDRTVTYTGTVVAVNTATITGAENGVAPDGTVTYVYYTDAACTTETTTANSGATSNGEAPKNVGTYYAKATIAAKGNYTAATSNVATIKINEKEVAAKWGETSLAYTGKNQTPTVSDIVGVNGETIKLTVIGAQSAVGGPYTATASITSVVASDGTIASASNYTLTNSTVKFYITNDNVTLNATSNVPSYTYDGTAKTPEVTVTAVIGGEKKTLTLDKDYTVSYDESTTAKDVGTKTITITGIGDYAGKGTTTTFEITTKELTLTPNAGQSKVYGAAEPTLTYEITGNVDADEPGKNGALSREEDTENEPDSVGTYKITQGTLTLADNGTFKASNYTLKFEEGVTFEITKKNISDLTLSLEQTTYEYNGEARIPGLKDPTFAGNDLVAGTDYEVTYENNTNAGQATAIITGKGNFEGSIRLTFTISKVNLEVTVSGYSGVYDGVSHGITVTAPEGAKVTYSTDGTTYSAEVPTYTNVSTNTIYVKVEKANYNTVTKNVTVEITAKDLTVVPNSNQSKEFGKADPEFTYTHSGNIDGETPVFSGNLSRVKGEELGTYEITLGNLKIENNRTFIANNYNLVIKPGVQFRIGKRNIADAIITLPQDSYEYNGRAQEPAVEVVLGDTPLAKDVDYEVKYTSNVNPGTAVVTITGIGNYEGQKEVTFTIINVESTAPIITAKVKDYEGELYTGKVTNEKIAIELTSNIPELVKRYEWSIGSEDNFTSKNLLTTSEGVGRIIINTEIIGTLYFRAVDINNEYGEVSSIEIKIDKTAPTGNVNIIADYEYNGIKGTNSSEIKVKVEATDNYSEATNMSIALINEKDFDLTKPNGGITWMDYEAEKTWTLTAGEGRRRVYVIIRDEAGNQSMYLAK